MRAVFLGLVATLTLSATATARAAEHIECVSERLSSDALQAIFQGLERNTAPPAVLNDVVGACMEQHGWSLTAANDAYQYGLALGFAHGLRAHPALTQDVRESVMRISDRIDDVTGRDWAANGVHGDDAGRMGALLSAEGLNPNDPVQAPAVATFLFSVQLRKYSLIDFAAH